MGRTVSAVVTWGDAYLGTIGPVSVSIPWWSEVEPVVAHLRAVLDVPVIVLRLLRVDGGDGSRDGHVTYHAAALSRPAPGLLAPYLAGHPAPPRPDTPAWPETLAGAQELTGPEELRSPWARLEGVRELLAWASDTLQAAGRPMTGPAVQRRTWNLSALFQLPTGTGPVWLKATPAFAADEAGVIVAFAGADPSLVPPVIGAAPGRVLLEHLPGEDCWDASPQIIISAVQRLTAAQAGLAGRLPGIPGIPGVPGLPDRRRPALTGQIRALLDGPVAASRGAIRPARCTSPNRSPTSPTPSATRNSSTASNRPNGSTTSVIPLPPSAPPSAARHSAELSTRLCNI